MDVTRMDVTRSADGTAISYSSAGEGPGLVVVPGNNRRAHHYTEFVKALPRYRTHVLDRRGRGASGPQGAAYSIDREAEDIIAVAAATGAELVFGHSYGGLGALHAALRRRFASIAVYEPGVSLGGGFPLGWLPEFNRRLAAGRHRAAMALFTKRTGLVPVPASTPMAVHYGLAYLLLRGADGAETQAMMPTTPAELGEIARLDSDGSRYAAIDTPTLVLAGAKTVPYILEAMPRLAAIIPGARYEALAGVDHNAPDLNGPAVVARHVDAFFTR
ncbi:alpha/beta fold hydrolase [Dactylosporangium sp. NPDC051541]|uniref:alpha/beta fold hydrolase n=1 Tax=Dactylosporangium sp. NPDC051541 TaxID=3363977 RepID=UPI00378D28FE